MGDADAKDDARIQAQKEKNELKLKLQARVVLSLPVCARPRRASAACGFCAGSTVCLHASLARLRLRWPARVEVQRMRACLVPKIPHVSAGGGPERRRLSLT